MYNGFTFPLEINDYNRAYFEEVKAEAEKLYDEPIRSLTYSTYKIYGETGSREEYEQEYMLHRKMLCAFTAMVITEQGDKWMDKLCDAIWAVCDEFTWVLPAHILAHQNTPETIATGRVDLFAGESAIALSEIYHILGDRLPQIIRQRIEHELERRIIKPYVEMKQKFGVSNWSGVCGCGVTAALVYMGKDKEFAEIKEHLMGNLKDFLDSFPDDGCCLEGSLYWFYGFSHFVFAAELLRQYTKGEIDYFENEKVKRIAYFANNMYLEDNYCISFADAPHTYDFDLGIMSFLAKKYDGITVPPLKYAAKFSNDARYRFGPFIRNLYWACELDVAEKKTGCYYYDKSEWYINRKNSYIFAAKAGYNQEPHNHNDVGSFLVFADGEFIIDDIGWERYVADYFGPNRYKHIAPASRSHCVPLVNGTEQPEGRKYEGVVTEVGENTFAFDYEKAYNVPELEKLSRRFELTDDGVVIKEFAKGNVDVVYRFVTRIKPEMSGDAVRIKNFELCCNNKAEIKISDFEFEPRFAGFGSEAPMYTAYVIDFVPENVGETEFVLKKVN